MSWIFEFSATCFELIASSSSSDLAFKSSIICWNIITLTKNQHHVPPPHNMKNKNIQKGAKSLKLYGATHQESNVVLNKCRILYEAHDKKRSLCHLFIFCLIDVFGKSDRENRPDEWKKRYTKGWHCYSPHVSLQILCHLYVAALIVDLRFVLCVTADRSPGFAAWTRNRPWWSERVPILIIYVPTATQLEMREQGKYGNRAVFVKIELIKNSNLRLPEAAANEHQTSGKCSFH